MKGKTNMSTNKTSTPKPQSEEKSFAFNKDNYKYMFIGLGLLVLGFLLMIGGGNEDPDEFSFGLFNFQRLTLAPILILAGLAMQIFAIMKRPKKD
jgi:DUF3098 family protein